MGKSYTELKKEFEQEWAKNLKLYIEAGMSPEFIAAMREFDEEVFRKERTFQDKTPSRIEYWDDPRLDNPVEYFSQPKKDLDTQLENILPGLSQRATKRDILADGFVLNGRVESSCTLRQYCFTSGIAPRIWLCSFLFRFKADPRNISLILIEGVVCMERRIQGDCLLIKIWGLIYKFPQLRSHSYIVRIL